MCTARVDNEAMECTVDNVFGEKMLDYVKFEDNRPVNSVWNHFHSFGLESKMQSFTFEPNPSEHSIQNAKHTESEGFNQIALKSLKDDNLTLMPELFKKLEKGIDVLEIGCGNGRNLNRMAGIFPNSRFTGYDNSVDKIFTARLSMIENCSQNIRFKVQDVVKMKETNKYDLILLHDVLQDQTIVDVVLRNLYRALKPQGVVIIHNIEFLIHLFKEDQEIETMNQEMITASQDVSDTKGVNDSIKQIQEAGVISLEQIKVSKFLKETGFSRVELMEGLNNQEQRYLVFEK